jgi:hypothetical protein
VFPSCRSLVLRFVTLGAPDCILGEVQTAYTSLPPHRAFSLVIAAIAFHFMTASTGGKLLDGQDYPTKWVGLMLGMSKFSFAPVSTL